MHRYDALSLAKQCQGRIEPRLCRLGRSLQRQRTEQRTFPAAGNVADSGQPHPAERGEIDHQRHHPRQETTRGVAPERQVEARCLHPPTDRQPADLPMSEYRSACGSPADHGALSSATERTPSSRWKRRWANRRTKSTSCVATSTVVPSSLMRSKTSTSNSATS